LGGKRSEEGTRPEARVAIFCNYCGKRLDLNYAINHVRNEHEQEIYTGVEPRRPGLRKRLWIYAMGVMFAGTLALIPLFMVYGEGLNGPEIIVVILVWFGGSMAAIGAAELISRRGEKSERQIYDDLFFQCWVCDARIKMGDSKQHMDTYHPEEVRRIWRQLLPLGILVIGFLGAAPLFYMIAESRSDLLLVIPAFAAVALALIVGTWFEYRVERPHVRRIREAWDRSHGTARHDEKKS